MAQYVRPTGDQATGAWTSTPLWSKVDEGAPGDGTSVTSDDNTTPDNADLQCNSVTDPAAATGHVLRAKWNKSATGGHTINAVLELWEGLPGSGTLRASLSVSDIGATPQTDTYTLSSAEANAISDYGNLYLRLSRQGDTGGSPSTRRSLVCDYCELEVPDAGLEVTTTAIASTLAFYVATLAYAVTAAAIPSGSVLSPPTVSPDQEVAAASVASGSSLSPPTVSITAVQDVTASFIGSAAGLSPPTVAYSVDQAAITSGSSLSPPALAYSVAGATVASGSSLSGPTVALGPAEVTTSPVSSTLSLHPPAIEGGVTDATKANPRMWNLDRIPLRTTRLATSIADAYVEAGTVRDITQVGIRLRVSQGMSFPNGAWTLLDFVYAFQEWNIGRLWSTPSSSVLRLPGPGLYQVEVLIRTIETLAAGSAGRCKLLLNAADDTPDPTTEQRNRGRWVSPDDEDEHQWVFILELTEEDYEARRNLLRAYYYNNSGSAQSDNNTSSGSMVTVFRLTNGGKLHA